MATKADILDQIKRNNYDLDEIVKFIKAGEISYADLSKDSGFPFGKRVEVKKMLTSGESIAWNNAKKSNSEVQLRNFINAYPNSEYCAEALKLIDDIKWNEVKGSDDVQKLQNFINSNPNNAHIAEARKQIDDIVWNEVKGSDDVQKLQNFINSNPNNAHIAEARKQIDDIQNRGARDMSDQRWSRVDKKDIEALQEFMTYYPYDPHYEDAEQLINTLLSGGGDIDSLIDDIKAIDSGKVIEKFPVQAIVGKVKEYLNSGYVTKDELLKAMKNDKNLLGAEAVRQLLKEGIIKPVDMLKAGIDQRFIQYLQKNAGQIADPTSGTYTQLDKLGMNTTEVYFWGIPSSGKSCALGSILKVAHDGEYTRSMMMEQCQGYDYMNRLINLFGTDKTSKNPVFTLPAGTATGATYEMRFILEDEKEKKYTITCVDLAGEMIQCMYKAYTNTPLSVVEQPALDTLTRILGDNRTTNRKIHFFVLEYDEYGKSYNGLNQDMLLGNAMNYINNIGIFKENTDAIFILVTKIDRLNTTRVHDAIKYYIKDKYNGFYKSLAKLCRDCQINSQGGYEPIVLPFSLGEVCFQKYCKLDDRYGRMVIELLLAHARGKGTGLWNKIKNGLSF